MLQHTPPTTPPLTIQSSTVQKNSTNSFEEIENKINATMQTVRKQKEDQLEAIKKEFFQSLDEKLIEQTKKLNITLEEIKKYSNFITSQPENKSFLQLLEAQSQQIKNLTQDKDLHDQLIQLMAETNNSTQDRTATNEKMISSLQDKLNQQQQEYSNTINNLKTTFDTKYVSQANYLELKNLVVQQNQSNSRLLNWLFAMTGGSTIVLLCWLWHYTHQ